MKISKHLHSCLLIEDKKKTVLIDPGVFTYQEKAIDLAKLTKLDYILITHEHPDHMHIPLIKELIQKFPEIKIVSNPSVAKLLAEEKMTVHTDLSVLPKDAGIQFEETPHEKLWDKNVPQNLIFTVFDKLTHPGDSHHFENTAEVLALPIQAPWGSTTAAVELALKLNPKVIIPVHDWMWKDGIRKAMYERLTVFFKEHGIDFKGLETGAIVEV